MHAPAHETPPDATSTLPPDLPQQAVELAADLLAASHHHDTPASRAHAKKIAALLADPDAKSFTLDLTDRVLRSPSPRTAAHALHTILARHGTPKFLRPFERLLLHIANTAARFLPGIVVPQINAHLRRDTRTVVVPAAKKPLHKFLNSRKTNNFRTNLNLLGEAVLGEQEAAARLQQNLDTLADPKVSYLSVKLSSVFSQINLVAYENTLDQLQTRLRSLYRAALEHGNSQHGTPKFINLDMEEYRDLHLTFDTFTRTLAEPEFKNLHAGIVLQAYLPDAAGLQQKLTTWARGRVTDGGAPIKVRLVKGANLAMEKVDASLHRWPLATHATKLDTDANFKRMLEFACRPGNATAVNLGVASHNLFDIAYALLLRDHFGTADQVTFEMLTGMAEPHAAAVRDRASDLLLYAPAVHDHDFHAAIAYLVRRLDENTHPDNFLHDLFSLEPGNPAWISQRDRFLAACQHTQSVPTTPNRTQHRATEDPAPDPAFSPFENCPDTDFSLPANRTWIATARRPQPVTIPLVVAGETLHPDHTTAARNPSRPDETAYTYSLGDLTHIDRALTAAAEAQQAWWDQGPARRTRTLKRVAASIAKHRGETIAALTLDGAKAVPEADTEISEAVDFANYYARSLDDPALHDAVKYHALGTVLVCPPWNFPYAIPAGGCLAALAAGNAVVLKPAPEAVLSAWHLANHFWEAGVPRDLLQFLPVPDDDTGRALVTDHRVHAVVLTGAYATADLFRSWKPDLNLTAETSGKNALVITASADLDLAAKDLVHGAFGHAGQKCSATSLALLTPEVYRHPGFRNQLRDAAASLKSGPAGDPATTVTPLVQDPNPDLLRALTQLDPGEQWLLEPSQPDPENCPNLWSPGIKLGVQPGSWFQQTECFGPVLGLVEVRDLDHAINVQNSSALGLTGGIHSLDPDEITRWRDAVEVGNAYINRSTTGAIIQRQPFGGWKNSSVGLGTKAGGPDYVTTFARWIPDGFPASTEDPSDEINALVDELLPALLDDDQHHALHAAAGSDAYHWRHHFSLVSDPSQLHGESNVHHYLPRPRLVLYLPDPENDPFPAARLRIAATLTKTLFTLIGSPADLRPGDLLRTPRGCPTEMRDRANALNIHVANTPLHLNARHELLHLLRPQSISQTTHRYGNLPTRP